MGSRRNNLRIIADILRIAKGGANKTRIVYRANLNFKLLNDYIKELERARLVEVDHSKRGEIRTTEKGAEFLNNFTNLMNMMNHSVSYR